MSVRNSEYINNSNWPPFWRETNNVDTMSKLYGTWTHRYRHQHYVCVSIIRRDMDIENSCQPFWKWLPQPPHTNIIAIFWFHDPANKYNDKDTRINFLSVLFAKIWDIKNSCQPFWKWLLQPPQTNIIAIFGFLDPENIDRETIINFISILFTEIWDIGNPCQPFWKWLPQPPRVIFFRGTHNVNDNFRSIFNYLF